jgi:hypothetical protein
LFKFRSKIEIEKKKQQKMKKKYLDRGPLGAARCAWVCGSSAPRRFKRGTGAPETHARVPVRSSETE